jgi:hypothetical protein
MPESYPSVLVLVDRWATPDQLKDSGDFVPPFLYVPDGRVIPTCVILVEEAQTPPAPAGPQQYPSLQVGGGYPVETEVQGEPRFGTVACMVSDGELLFGLTARHVAGRAGQEIKTVLDGAGQGIGWSDRLQHRKLPFDQVYPGWPGTHCLSNLDLGLVRVKSHSQWTSQIYGLGELDEMENLTPESISLDLIGNPVRGCGAASGEMLGEIHGFFYRYKSVGGLDYVTDVVIGPRRGERELRTRPGDSGTLWVFDPQGKAGGGRRLGATARRWKPFAIQWGGHQYVGAQGEGRYGYALATFLSTACRMLDVELVRSWGIGLPEYWGKPIHFRVGYYAFQLLSKAEVPHAVLAEFVNANLPSIGWATMKDPDKKQQEFYDLADAPDRWAFYGPRPQDQPSHCVNFDTLVEGKGTLLEWSEKEHFSPQGWADFYEAGEVAKNERGALPFRVAQVFNELVGFLKAGKPAEALFALGVIAHYAGDATMPLHGIEEYKGQEHDLPKTDDLDVHKFYDRKLMEKCADLFGEGMSEEMSGASPVAIPVPANHNVAATARSVATACLDAMVAAGERCPKERLFKAYKDAWTDGEAPNYEACWEDVGKDLCWCAARGAELVAGIWLAAWKLGRGEEKLEGEGKIDASVLEELWGRPDFLECLTLEELQPKLGY